MKIEQLIVQHLYNSKKVTLQDIGTFILSPDVPIAFESDKEMVMPENAVSFEYNKKATQDEDLINFIVAQTRKIKPLATSDLESYSILAKQFLNIGKPFPIEGLGVLQKSQAGIYEFTQGNYINARLDAAPALLREKADEDISFSTQARPASSQKTWMYILVLFFVLATAAALYYFLREGNKEEGAEVVQTNQDTIAVPVDTIVKPITTTIDSTTIPAPLIPNDSSVFKIVIKEYPGKEAADKAFAKLSGYGHKLLLYPKDSVNYKIAMPFMRPLSDTLRARDSLKIFFGGTPYVEITKP